MDWVISAMDLRVMTLATLIPAMSILSSAPPRATYSSGEMARMTHLRSPVNLYARCMRKSETGIRDDIEMRPKYRKTDQQRLIRLTCELSDMTIHPKALCKNVHYLRDHPSGRY